MKRTRRTQITVETERLWVVTGKPASRITWCDTCQECVAWVDLECAGLITGNSHRSISRHLELGNLHFQDGPLQARLICLKSLFDLIR